MHKRVKQLVNKVGNMWIDESSRAPKITGLTKTAISPSTPKKRAVRKKRAALSIN